MRIKQLITRKRLANELKDTSPNYGRMTLRESQNIVIKENKGGKQMNINNMNTEHQATVYHDAFYKSYSNLCFVNKSYSKV